MVNDAIVRSTCARPGPIPEPAAVPIATANASTPPTAAPTPGRSFEPADAAAAARVQGLGSGPTLAFVIVLFPIVVFATRRWWRPVRLRRGMVEPGLDNGR